MACRLVNSQTRNVSVNRGKGPTRDAAPMPAILPGVLDVFVAEVVPLLQKRGLFRTAYEGTTLRDHFGLPRFAVSV